MNVRNGILMLTDRLIKSSKLTEKGTTKTITDGGGLSLYITHTGKYWQLRYYIDGKQQLMSLGQCPILSLLEVMLFFAASMKQSISGKFSYGEKLRGSQSLNMQ